MYKAGGNEAHITANIEHATVVRDMAEHTGWIYSQIAGCPLLGPGTYCYLTSYDRDAHRLKRDMRAVCESLEKQGVTVLRSKIEHIVFDTKTDVNELMEGY